jgi:intron-binding protein aquarius
MEPACAHSLHFVVLAASLTGVQPGLTMVVGPPGTGKTDTAVQIMHVLYHNCPAQRTLVIAHSNQVRPFALLHPSL